jgi:hypothetical protein
MSPSRAPGRTTAMPRIMASCVRSTTRRASTLGTPTKNMRLVSPWKPFLMTVTSMLMMSPSRSTLSPGMPWQTTWLTDVQIAPGKGGRVPPAV